MNSIKKIKQSRKQYIYILVSILILALTTCTPIEIVFSSPQPTVTVSNTAYYTPEPTPTPVPSLPFTPEPLPQQTTVHALEDIKLPNAILIFSPQEGSVFRVQPGGVETIRVMTFDWPLTAVDVLHTPVRPALDFSSIPAQMAFGTHDGYVRILNPGDGYNRGIDVRSEKGFPLFVESVAWSPDGTQVAYIVNRTDFGTGPNPAAEERTGLWVYTPDVNVTEQMIRNQYFDEVEDIEDIRLLRDPVWSPDGTGLILTGSFWEWFDILIFDPIVLDLEGETLYDPFEDLWIDASWSLDGKSIYVSGRAFASTGGLYRVNRETLETEVLIDGDADGIIIFYAHELPDGIAFVAWDESMLPILYLGNETNSGFEYVPVGDGEPVCDFPIFHSIEWNPSGDYLLVSCNGEWRLLSLDGSVNVDLAPYLDDLVTDPDLELLWDYSR